jgi:uncharacterized membrane protein
MTARMDLARRRVLISGLSAVPACVVAIALGASWSVVVLCAADVAEIVFCVHAWRSVHHSDPANTAQLARSEDSSPISAELALIAAGCASLIAVVFALARAGQAKAPESGLLTGLGIASVLLAWATVHTVFMFRYARLYYSDPIGGIAFGDEPPEFADFAYVALTIGMTFQVSDTDLTFKRIRRVALHHALLSYLYGAFIVAITVSSVATLLSG